MLHILCADYTAPNGLCKPPKFVSPPLLRNGLSETHVTLYHWKYAEKCRGLHSIIWGVDDLDLKRTLTYTKFEVCKMFYAPGL